MAPRKRNGRDGDSTLVFEALAIEGGLLSPAWLAKVAQQQAGQQAPEDYGVTNKRLQLRDEIGRYWRIAQGLWDDFRAGREANGDAAALAEKFAAGMLRDAFGFESLVVAELVVLDERTWPLGHRALDGRVPVVIAPAGSGLDTLSPVFGDDGRRRSAFGLAQEYLNADDGALWGIATDGVTLRLCRDNASLTRPAWIEADLQRIFTEERYADFSVLWLLLHESRFGKAGQPVADCPLEAWRKAGLEQGTRARDKLRGGVEEALIALGRGFLSHPENQPLRAALQSGKLAKEAYFQQLLRLVYRLIFLITAEERGVLHPPGAPEAARQLYQQGYGLRRLRDRAVKRSAHDRFVDAWEALGIVLRGLAAGQPRLALPALGGLFAANQCPDLDGAKLENRWLMAAIFKLGWLKEDAGLARVNWRDMGPEELGSVYESLLELVPQIPEDGRGFAFATGSEAKGNARKTSGSYYTPDSLVQVLLDSALEPVVKQTVLANPRDPVEALLQLTVVDPACGSGHFLLSAGRRLAGHVARLQAGGTPSAEQYRAAVRQVVSRCLFGVDLNPMAVELCRVALWMEAVEPGRPLSFLDSHIQQGNALLGTTPELMAKGIPDAAFEPIEGDDRATARALKARNKAAADGQRGFDALWSKAPEAESAEVTKAVADLDAAPDASLDDVAGKEAKWEELQRSLAFTHQKFVADAWCAAFVWPKPPTPPRGLQPAILSVPPPVIAATPTNELWRQIRDGQGQPPPLTVKTVQELAGQYQFFHWHLAFPQVFARGGFDVVLGNPPWERPKPEPARYFAELRPEISEAQTSAARAKLLERLKVEDSAVYGVWAAYERSVLGAVHFQVSSGSFPLSAVGKFNLGNTFVERARLLLSLRGRAGLLNVSGLATDDSGKELISDLMKSRTLVCFYDFENKRGLFPAVHSSYKFSALTVAGAASELSAAADFVFFAHDVSDLEDASRHVSFSADDIRKLNPLSGNCPVFRNRRQANVVRGIYDRARLRNDVQQVLWDWDAEPTFLFVMSDHSRLFSTRDDLGLSKIDCSNITPFARGARWLPLYESKMFHQYEHRWANIEADGEQADFTPAQHEDPSSVAVPRYWMREEDAAVKLGELPPRAWLLAVREVTNATNERTAIAAVLPQTPVGHNAQVFRFAPNAARGACFVACLNSFALDFAARTKVGGSHLSSFILRQLPILACTVFSEACSWYSSALTEQWVSDRVLELTYTAWDLEPFAKDVGYEGPPFHWDPDRRFLLRAELDAAFFHLYGISRDDTDYILETFPIVKKNDEKAHGEYRTKRVILEIYDAMAEAIRTGKPYQTRLDPPPADPRVAHPEGSTPGWAKGKTKH